MINKATLGTFVSKPETFARAGGELGAGCFGKVSEAVIPGMVVKTVENFWNDGWFPWALYCLKHQGETGIPTIYALRLDFTEGKLWALMECLSEVTWDDHTPWMQVGRESFPYRVRAVFGRRKAMPAHLTALMATLPDQGLRVDLHRGNYMKRGQKLVMTDPFTLTYDDMWLDRSGMEGTTVALKWARQTLDTLLPEPDPRVIVVGTPEERLTVEQERDAAEKAALEADRKALDDLKAELAKLRAEAIGLA